MTRFFTYLARRHAVRFAVVAGLALTALLGYMAWMYVVNHERQLLSKESEILSQDFTSSLVTAVQSLHDLTLLFRASDHVSADEFHIFSESMLARHPFLQATLYMPLVVAGDEIIFQKKMRSMGYLNFQQKPVVLSPIPGAFSPIMEEPKPKDFHRKEGQFFTLDKI